MLDFILTGTSEEIKFYLKHIPSKVAFIQDSLSVDILRPNRTVEACPIEQRPFYSMSKPILSLAIQGGESKEQYVFSSIESSEKLKSNSILADLGNCQISEDAGKSLYSKNLC